MDKPYGAQGEIANFRFKDLQESFYNQDGMEIEIKDGVLYVGVDDEKKFEEAKELARLYLTAWSIRQNIKVRVDFNRTWKTNPKGNKNHCMALEGTVSVRSRLRIEAPTSHLVTKYMHDSASFASDTPIVNKARQDVILRNALYYFSEEVIENAKPLSGIYKALEEITRRLGKGNEGKGRKKFAQLVGESRKYVDDVMQTTQTARHSEEWLALTKAKAVLSDSECKERARKLLMAYADSLP